MVTKFQLHFYSILKCILLCTFGLSNSISNAKSKDLLLTLEGGLNLSKNVRFNNLSDLNISNPIAFGGKTVVSLSKEIDHGISPIFGIGFGVYSSRIQTHFTASLANVENSTPFVSNFSWLYSGPLLKLGIRKDFIFKKKLIQSFGIEIGSEFQMLEMFGEMNYNNSVTINDTNQEYLFFNSKLDIASKYFMPVYYVKVDFRYKLNSQSCVSLNLGYFNAFNSVGIAEYQFSNVTNPTSNSFRILFNYTNIGIGFHFKLN